MARQFRIAHRGGRGRDFDRRKSMKREIIRVEPLATYLEKYKAPASTVTKHGDTIYVSGSPPFDHKTGEIFKGPIERQTEIVLDQLKLCVETAGSSLENILKLNVYVTSVDMFPAVNAVYRRYFPENPPARIFINVPAWNGGVVILGGFFAAGFFIFFFFCYVYSL